MDEGIVGIAVARSVSAGGDVGAVVGNIGAEVGELVAEIVGAAVGRQAASINTNMLVNQCAGFAWTSTVLP